MRNEMTQEEMLELYEKVKNFKFFLLRSLGPDDLEDNLEECYARILGCISRGELRNPERLVPYIATFIRYYASGQIDRRVVRRRCRVAGDPELVCKVVADEKPTPEHLAILSEKKLLCDDLLSRLKPRDGEILRRFYLVEQTKEQICAEMGLTHAQFRRYKSRAKEKLRDNTSDAQNKENISCAN